MGGRKQDSGIGHKQTERLFRAARWWKEQGSRSKWKSEPSLNLWDTIVDIEKSLTPKSQIFEVDGASSTRGIKPKLSLKKIHRVMEKGLADDQRVWIHYVDRHGELTERLIKPVVVTDHGVNAYCYAREGGRYFIYDSTIDARLVSNERMTTKAGTFGLKDCPMCEGFGFKREQAVDGMMPLCECISAGPPKEKDDESTDA